MAEKVTEMLLKVHDLDCSKCYKKVKKILCKFPQIHDQVYDVKNNTVKIKVVSSCPEKIRDKICCKGRGIIKCIEILKPPPPPPPPPVETPKPCCKKDTNTPVPKPCCTKDKNTPCCTKPKSKPCCTEDKNTPCCTKPKPKPCCTEDKNTPCCTKPKPKPCCTECSEGRGGGPCYNPGSCGRPVCSCGCGGSRGNCGRTVCSCGCGGSGGNCRRTGCSCGCGGSGGHCGRPVCSCGCGGYRSHCEYYFSEDNSQGCTIM